MKFLTHRAFTSFFKIKDTSYSTGRIITWLCKLLKHHKTQITLNVMFGALTVALDFSFIAATKQAVDIATHTIEGNLFTQAMLLSAILLSNLAISFASRWTKAILGVRAQNDMQEVFFSRMLHTDWVQRKKNHSGDILNRLERDVIDVVNTLTETLPSMLTITLRLVGAFIFLFTMEHYLALACICIIPLFIALSKLYVKHMRSLTRSVRDTDSKIQSLLQESIQHHMVIQTLEQESHTEQKLKNIHTTLAQQIKQRTKFSSTSAMILSAGFMICYLMAFLWGTFRLYQGTISYGMMLVFIQLVGQIQSPFRDLTRFIPILVNTLTASERLMQLEEIPLEESKGGNHQVHFFSPGIRFRNVTYAYSSTSRNIVRDFSHDFIPGSQTAIIGKTGAGKTTLIRLMLGLIHPQEGTIQLYNNEQALPCDASTRNHFVYVPQGNTLLSGTILDNLLMGKSDATQAEIEKAIHTACAQFIYDLPQGLHTPCTELGGGVSEGQAQRIAIARALLRPGSILLLDEATSALDKDTEQQLWHNIMHEYSHHTLIFVTHKENFITGEMQVLRL